MIRGKVIVFMLATGFNLIGAAVLASDILRYSEVADCGVNLFILFTAIILLSCARHLRIYSPWLARIGAWINVLILLLALLGVFGFLTGGA